MPIGQRNSTAAQLHEIRFRQTKLEWEKYFSGNPDIDLSVIPQAIFDSWQRCRNAGLNHLKKPVTPVLSGSGLQSLLEKNRLLLNACLPVIHHFDQHADSTDFILSLFNRQGYLLEVLVDPADKLSAQSLCLIPGALWSEEALGSNSPGSVLIQQKPVRFFGPQHYNENFHSLTASSVPIFDPQGNLLGGISLITHYRDDCPTLAMAVTMSQAIENSLKANEALQEARIAAYYQQTINDAVAEAVIGLDASGRITMMNETSLNIFQITRYVEGMNIRDVLKNGGSELLRLVEEEKWTTDSEIQIVCGQRENTFRTAIRPVYSDRREMVGKVIILQEIRRTLKPVVRATGAKAFFQIRDICGQNSKFLRTVQHVEIAAKSDSNVLLLGESGTGKDIFAQAIHTSGTRRKGPYVAINCASIPRDLIASELFGHTEGAFTGSRRGGNTGKFELADGGTIFFDEIAETSLEFQSALLRAVEEKAIVRVGGSNVRPVDVRIIAATNKNIMDEIRKGAFRQDLYYRLNVFTIETIPLRSRKDDIPLLIDNFIRKHSGSERTIKGIDPMVVRILENYPWPGNVRELQNVIERMINVSQGLELTVDMIPEEILHWQHTEEQAPGKSKMKDLEKETILRMMQMDIPRNKIAEKMNMARSTFYRKLKEYGLD